MDSPLFFDSGKILSLKGSGFNANMSPKEFHNLNNYQCLALAFCLLLFNQQVLGKVETRRRYESPFEDLFEEGKHVAKQLAAFYHQIKDNKEVRQTTDKITTFVKANPDRVGIGLGIVASSWLLYQSIDLGKIERFFDEIEELKGQFKEYSRLKMPKLEELYHRAGEATDYSKPEKQKAYTDVCEELLKYFAELQDNLNKIDDFTTDVNKRKRDAGINAAISSTLTVLAVFIAIVIGGPVTIATFVWTSVAVAMMGISTASTIMSLKNAHDLTMASERLTTEKHDLRRLREVVKENIEEIIRFIQEISLDLH